MTEQHRRARDQRPPSAIVVSPHLDDAVLSAWTRLSAGNVTVITVFTGLPPPTFTVSPWDLETGAASSHDRMYERLSEDEAALGGLGVPTIRLGKTEFEYRDGEDTDVVAIADVLRPHIADCAELWLPAGIGAHPDHIATRDAGIVALIRTPGPAVRFYADFPYVADKGWPSWITAVAACGPHTFVSPESTKLCPLCFRNSAPLATLVVLTPDEQAAKLSTLHNYRSQLNALDLTDEQLIRTPQLLKYELSWTRPARHRGPDVSSTAGSAPGAEDG